MTKRMLIDTSHPEETRVVVLDGNRLEEFDVETSTKRQIKGNVYLAKVVRVEPSLQAAFVEYGGNRHGFLAFSEIHPDYYQIPVADRQALIAEQEARQRAADEEEEHRAGHGQGNGNGSGDGDDVEILGGEETVSTAPASIQANGLRHYKIQEVIKRRQIVLVQVVKEERGNKGAALTTYLSLAGRYCVFMPNTARGGGVSRKISSQTDRRRLKSILGDLHGPAGGSVILRTAGAERSKAEIKRDFDFLMRQWEQIKDTTLKSIAPSLIHEEGNLIKRAMRDIYTRDIEEIVVDGEDGYRGAKDFMKMLTPSHARKVQPYRDQAMPLFHRFQVESQLDAMHSPVAHLRSGGYLVFNQTEALVAIDVNSGKATKERHIEETALKTNLEAADEVARQLRLRDLAGLIVIDFIDMDDGRNNAAVERRLKEALKLDRARIQVGRISAFGLLEMSRQRLRPSLMETAFHTCRHCQGTGVVRSIESTAIHMLRVVEEEGVRRRSAEVTLKVPTPVALYILNNKRAMLAAIEARYDFRVLIAGDDGLIIPEYALDRIQAQRDESEAQPAAIEPPANDDTETDDPGDADTETGTDHANNDHANNDGGDDDGAAKANAKKRRRRRRRPRRDGEDRSDSTETTQSDDDSDADQDRDDGVAEDAREDQTEDGRNTGEADPSDNGTRDEGETGDGETEDGQRESRSRRSRRRRGGRRNRTRSGEETDGETGLENPIPANDTNGGDSDGEAGLEETDGVEDGAIALLEAVETEWADDNDAGSTADRTPDEIEDPSGHPLEDETVTESERDEAPRADIAESPEDIRPQDTAVDTDADTPTVDDADREAVSSDGYGEASMPDQTDSPPDADAILTPEEIEAEPTVDAPGPEDASSEKSSEDDGAAGVDDTATPDSEPDPEPAAEVRRSSARRGWWQR